MIIIIINNYYYYHINIISTIIFLPQWRSVGVRFRSCLLLAPCFEWIRTGHNNARKERKILRSMRRQLTLSQTRASSCFDVCMNPWLSPSRTTTERPGSRHRLWYRSGEEIVSQNRGILHSSSMKAILNRTVIAGQRDSMSSLGVVFATANGFDLQMNPPASSEHGFTTHWAFCKNACKTINNR